MKIGLFEFGVAASNSPREQESGDRYLLEVSDTQVLLALIDAVGHGHAASEVANIAIATIRQHASEPIGAIMLHCHQSLLRKRGVTLSIACYDRQAHTVNWLGVGDVSGVLMHVNPKAKPRIRELLVRGGLLGDRLPALNPVMHQMELGDTLIMASDGIRSSYTDILTAARINPQLLAERILATYAKGNDDATVVVFRCWGEG